jgi:hypothetical protein
MLRAATGLAFFVASLATAASADLPTEPPPALKQAAATAAVCAELWATKTIADVERVLADSNRAIDLQQTRLGFEAGLTESMIEDANDEYEELNGALKENLEGILRQAAKDGRPINFETAAEEFSRIARNNPERMARLRGVEASLRQLKKKFAEQVVIHRGWSAMKGAIAVCADEQRAYLGKQGTPKPAATLGLKITGTFNAVCVSATTGKSVDYSGTFVLDLEPQTAGPPAAVSEVNGTLDFGTGPLALKGNLTRAAGSPSEARLQLEDTAMHVWKLEGDVSEAQGEYITAGNVSAQDPSSGDDCKGKFNGKQAS